MKDYKINISNGDTFDWFFKMRNKEMMSILVFLLNISVDLLASVIGEKNKN